MRVSESLKSARGNTTPACDEIPKWRKRTTHVCGNPLNRPGHAAKTEQTVKPGFRRKYEKLYPALKHTSYVCVRCKMLMSAKKVRRDAVKKPVCQSEGGADANPHIEPSPPNVIADAMPITPTGKHVSAHLSHVSYSASEPSQLAGQSSIASLFETQETQKHDVLQISAALGVTPITRVTDKTLIGFYKKVKSSAKKQLEPFLTSPEVELSPTAGSKFRKDSIRDSRFCVSCDTLIQMSPIKFRLAESRQEQYKILTSLPKSLKRKEIADITGCTTYMAQKSQEIRKEQGSWSAPHKPTRPKISNEIINVVRDFYLDNENSRVNPDIRRTIRVLPIDGGEAIYEPRRQILLTVRELYREFQVVQPGIKISISKFATLRPKQCAWTGTKTVHNTCTCEEHQNYKLLMDACGIKFTNKVSEQLGTIFCDTASSNCMLGYCTDCPKEAMIPALLHNFDEDVDTIKYKYWGKEKGTYGVQLHSSNKSREDFLEHLSNKIPKFAKHHFRMKVQQRYIHNLTVSLPSNENSAIVTVDFAMNYRCIVQDSPQAFHWTNVGITLLTIAVQLIDPCTRLVRKEKYVVISDSKDHDATSFHVFRAKFLQKFKENFPFINRLIYVSDGTASQFKNTKNLLNLMFHKDDFGLTAEWQNTATSHGKSECDAIGAIVKSSARRASLALDERTILSANDLYHHVLESQDTLHIRPVQVTQAELIDFEAICKLKERYSLVDTIRGTQKCHAFIPMEDGILLMREFSESTSFELIQVIPKSKETINTSVQPEINEGRSLFQLDDYWAFSYRRTYFVGLIKNVILNEDNQNVEIIEAQVMKRGKGNAFYWYPIPKQVEFQHQEALKKMKIPLPDSCGKFYRVDADDYNDVCALLKSK